MPAAVRRLGKDRRWPPRNRSCRQGRGRDRTLAPFVRCVSGALLLDEYSHILTKAGLQQIEVTPKAVSSCVETDGQDPIFNELLKEVDNPKDLLNSIVSVNVQAIKP